MEKTTTRRFSLSFDEVITKAQSMQPQFETDIDRFIVFNPWFTPIVNSKLQADLSAGLIDFSGSSHTAEIQRQTEAIGQMLGIAGRKYQTLLYYVENGLGNSKAMTDTFGRSRYEKARQSEKEMVSLLNQACSAVGYDGYKTKLLASGMPYDLPEELAVLADDLAVADGRQEMLKKKQLLVTSERIDLFNSIWDTLSRISAAAKIIFEDDPARLAIYQLYDTKSASSAEPVSTEA
ncbi:MAG TPA: hypothetical protein VFC65_12370 [Prolixibacteraceae bacterium]|nr:hypothetical protein [Prolixibacteraceae bacterium]